MGEGNDPVKRSKSGMTLFSHTVRFCVNAFAGLAAAVMLAFVLLVWRVSEGPVSIALLAPYISQAIDDTLPGVRATFKDTILIWAGWERALDVRIIDLQISTRGGETVGFLPETAFSLSGEALLRGRLAAAELELFEPTLSLERDASGRFEFGFGGINAGESPLPDVTAGDLLTWLSDEQGGANPAAFLDILKITDADIIIDDQLAGRSWVTPDAHLSIRRDEDGFALGATLMATIDDAVAELLVSGQVEKATGDVQASVSFDGINPAGLATLTNAAAPLARIYVPVGGIVAIEGNIDGRLDAMAFDLTGGDGDIALPEPFETTLGVTDVHLVGELDAVVNRLTLEHFAATFEEDTSILLPGIPDHAYDLQSVAFTGSYQDGENRLAIDDLSLQMSELQIDVSGVVDDLLGRPTLMLDARVSTIRVADFPIYWPAALGDDAYDWVIPNITKGAIDDVTLTLDGEVGAGDTFEINQLDGSFTFVGVEVSYLDSMPPVTDAKGRGRFNHDQIEFFVDQATSYEMTARDATVGIYGISGAHEQAKIKVPLSGSFRHAMELVDREPLGYARELGIDPANVEGETSVNLAFDFPLLLDLGWENVSASALASVENVNIPDGLFDLDVRDAAFEIDIDNDGMDIIGDLKLEGYATNINWNQQFDPETSVRNSYTLNVWVNNVESLADLGLRTGPFADDLIKGDMPLWLNVTERRDGEAILNARADLTGVDLNLTALEWEKQSGIAGEARVELKLRGGEISEIAAFSLRAPELLVDGSADYDDETFKLSHVEITRATIGRTDLSGQLIPRDDSVWDADFSGQSLDLAGLWDEVFESDLMESGDSLLPSLVLSAQFDRVWLSEDEHIDNLTSAFVRDGEEWRTIFITTVLEDNETLGIKLAPSDDGASRNMTMWSEDAGAVLRFLRINDNVIGGDFSLSGRFDDANPDGPLVGQMQIEGFRVLNAPTLTKVVSVMSLTGIVESLGGEGLYFSQLDIPFTYDDGTLTMTDAQANGPSLGFTANGKIYTHADVVDIQGTVVPAYMINSLLGNIPVIGNIFSGGEAGGGVFAVRYVVSGSRDEPEVSVNPLSALTPGFLRNLFGFFDGQSTDEPPPG